MALSNWDTLAIGPESTSIPGEFKFANGVEIEIYKNWVNLTKRKKRIAGINSMEGSVHDISIEAIRDEEQNSIFVVASYWIDKTETEPGRYEIFAGIGCYGYGNLDEEFLKSKGYDIDLTDENLYTTTSWETKNGKETTTLNVRSYDRTVSFDVEVPQGVNLNPWVGVSASTLQRFRDFLEKKFVETYSEEKKAWFNKIDWDNLLRYNQGNAYFTKALGIDLDASKVGEGNQPVIMDMIAGMKEKRTEE